jgi:diaminopimelate epimerase
MPSSRLTTPLIKASATGNDFLFVDLIDQSGPALFPAAGRPTWVRAWCDRHQGIGADGVAFLERAASPGLDFAWDFYNSDGSPAEMCGNASRAVALHRSLKSGRSEIAFQTKSGEVRARVNSADDIEVALAPVAESAWNQWSGDDGPSRLSFDFVRAGVPHAVLRVPDIGDRESLRALAAEVKRDRRFHPHGTNVTFVHPVSSTILDSVTFERGVEDFTLSCGTGAVAAAHSHLRGEEGQSVEVRVPGGRLSVVWKDGRPHLRGPARIIAEIHWLAPTGG